MKRRRSKAPPTADELEQKLDSIRPDGSSDRPLDPADVTGVLDLALERVSAAQDRTQATLQTATQRLLRETAATRALTRALTDPPKGHKP